MIPINGSKIPHPMTARPLATAQTLNQTFNVCMYPMNDMRTDPMTCRMAQAKRGFQLESQRLRRRGALVIVRHATLRDGK